MVFYNTESPCFNSNTAKESEKHHVRFIQGNFFPDRFPKLCEDILR